MELLLLLTFFLLRQPRVSKPKAIAKLRNVSKYNKVNVICKLLVQYSFNLLFFN